jgi:hypothetical protein
MTATGTTIRSLFATKRPIDRPIEKVIDYYADDAARLRSEVDEYEVTENVAQNLRRFLDVFGEGVQGGRVTETGIWVSGFYGSGKSSFTKYLGFALNPNRLVDGRPFLDLFAERIDAIDLRQQLKALAVREPTAVIMLDLGSEQLASSASAEVSKVLYLKVLQWAGYSREEKLAQLELHLERDGRYGDFEQAYEETFGGKWRAIHNDPLVAVPRADQLAPRFYPQEYPEPGAFRATRFSLNLTVREFAAEMLDIVRRRSGHRNVLFLIDEVGQYVAPRGELILNLDGLARAIKELGQGRAWMVATGQQTLTEIVERAAYNSTELNKLRDRFPIAIELDARDIREITYRRLLSKSAAGEQALRDLFARHGQAMASHTRLTGTTLFKGDPDEDAFVKFYPFLPQHFDLLMELVSKLARSRGGVGLRSAIRVIQDLLVDASKALPPGTPLLADRPVGTLATVDGFFDTLRADINKEAAHVVAAVDRIERAMAGDTWAIRVGKAIAALQLIESFPRTAENLAALLYHSVGAPPNQDEVRGALGRILEAKEIGLVDDPQTGHFTFLSEGVKPLREKRNAYQPTGAELATLRSGILRGLFDPLPSATIDGQKTVRAGVRWGRNPLSGDDEEVQIQLESVGGVAWNERRSELLTETTGGREWQATIAWLIQPGDSVEDVLAEIAKSQEILRRESESEADKDKAQFLRAERRTLEANQDRARKLFQDALLAGTLIFRGKPTPASSLGDDIATAARKKLHEAAVEVYPKFHLVKIRPSTDLAAKFLAVQRLDRATSEVDPLHQVKATGGRARVDPDHPALAEALRAFQAKLDQSETTRLQGNAIQDLFAAAPYGWSKDATRYVFAGLLFAGEIALFTPAGEVKTPGPAAIEAMKNTQAFNRTGVGLRDSRPSLDTLDRAAARLEPLAGESVMPLEDQISQAARERLPARLDPLTALPTRLQYLSLAGAGRAQEIAETGRAILQGDGSAAVAILGAADCTFPDDIRWAETVTRALDSGGVADVNAARAVMDAAEMLNRLFPAVEVVTAAERATIADVLGSEAFADRLADLRGAVRAVRARSAATYREEATGYQRDLEAARTRIEERWGWLNLTEDDRAELASQLTSDLPQAVPEDQALSELSPLLARRGSVAAREAAVAREVDARQPLPPEPSDSPGGEAVITLDQLLPPDRFTNADEINHWLETVRARLIAALDGHTAIRLEAVELTR